MRRFASFGLVLALAVPGAAVAEQRRAGGAESQADALAQALQRLAASGRAGGWAAVRAAFPNARWNPHERFNPPISSGESDLLTGGVALGGAGFGVNAHGVARGPTSIEIYSDEPAILELATLQQALRARGATFTLLGCDPGYAAWAHGEDRAPTAFLRIDGPGGGAILEFTRATSPTLPAPQNRYTTYAVRFAMSPAELARLDQRHCDGATPNAAAPTLAAASPSANVPAAQPRVAALTGTRPERIAQLLLNSLAAGGSRDWAAAQAAFPGARWERRTSDTAQTATINGQTFPTAQSVTGSTDVIVGTITLGRLRYEIGINGSQSRVFAISFNSPEDEVDDRDAIRRAFEARGGQWRSQGCVGMQMEIVRLSHAGVSVLVDFSTNMGSRVGPSSHYVLEFQTPPETADLERCES